MSKMQSTFDHIVRGHQIVREATTLILDSTDADEVGRQLEGLAEVLPDHFSYEEQPGGYFDHLRGSLHHADSRLLAKFVDDHQYLEGELHDLLEAEARDQVWLEWAQEYARNLREHEAGEARLAASVESSAE
jgi:hypothetical protein